MTPLAVDFVSLLSSSSCRCLLLHRFQEPEIPSGKGRQAGLVPSTGWTEEGWLIWCGGAISAVSAAGSRGGGDMAVFVQRLRFRRSAAGNSCGLLQAWSCLPPRVSGGLGFSSPAAWSALGSGGRFFGGSAVRLFLPAVVLRREFCLYFPAFVRGFVCILC